LPGHLPFANDLCTDRLCSDGYSYSPIRDETGQVCGVFTATSETTLKVISERRLRTLRDLGGRAMED
jgi:hypothetical protein